MKSKISDIAERLRKRFFYLSIILMGALAIIIGKLFWIEIFHGEEYTAATQNRSRSSSVITAKRGDIYDRNNVLLASSTTEYNLILDPVIINDPQHNYLDNTAALLQKCFGISASEVIQKAGENQRSRYIVLKKGLTYNQVKDFMEMSSADSDTLKAFLGLPESDESYIEVAGAWLEDYYKRNYTYGTTASSVLGFTQDGIGVYGLEKYYNSELAGTDGKKYTYLSDDNVVESIYHEEENGNSVLSTIDYNIQSIVEKYMMETLEETGAKTVAVTIQNPNTGEFLAMADTGLFDPNSPRDLTVRYSQDEIDEMTDQQTAGVLNENWKNFCVTETYEPGSTFKAFTVAGALESGSITTHDMFECEGYTDIRDYTIHCANLEGHDLIDLTGSLAESCNMAMIQIANEEGVDTFCKYQTQFGFGSLTGIDLPMEMSCRSLMFTRTNMTDIDLATNSFGQNFNVTMVQLSTAFSAIVNGGTYYRPYIVKGIYNSKGEMIKSVSKTVISKPVSSDTCKFIKSALRRVVTEGTGTDAVVPGYITAGKTGTAEKGARDQDLWVASFIGFAPYENPELVCYVVIDEPAAGGDGSSVYACELFSKIMSEVLPYINATPASMDYDPTGIGSPERVIEDNDYEDNDYEDDDSDEDYDDEDDYYYDSDDVDYYDDYDDEYYDEDYYYDDGEDYYWDDDNE